MVQAQKIDAAKAKLCIYHVKSIKYPSQASAFSYPGKKTFYFANGIIV